MRKEYIKSGLSAKDLSQDPFQQFELWYTQAEESIKEEANAMALTTVSHEGLPSSRMVLMKYYDRQGFVFFTNYSSRKSKEIDQNAHVCALYYWPELERQIRIEGTARKISAAESMKYFLSRPRGSQLGAWCSNQSTKISSRQVLHSKFEEIKEKFRDKTIDLPSFWGGYKIYPTAFEFWQGRENRLHDRFQFILEENQSWTIHRLAP